MENYKNFNKDQKTVFWSEHFSSWKKSGLSQRKYCEETKLSYWSFRTWYYKSRSVKDESKFIRINPPRTQGSSTSKITIVLTDKIKIEYDENITEEALRRIFKASEVLND